MFYLPSHPLYLTLFPLYLCHQTQCINYSTPTLCFCTTSHALYVWHHIQYAWHHMNSLWHHTPRCMTSHPVYLWHHIQNILYHPYCFHENTTTIPKILPTIFNITAPCICVVTPALLMPSQQLWKSSHLEHVWHHIHSTSCHIHTLWHQSCVVMTSQPLHSWHHISYIWHYIHGLWYLIPYTCDLVAIISVT